MNQRQFIRFYSDNHHDPWAAWTNYNNGTNAATSTEIRGKLAGIPVDMSTCKKLKNSNYCDCWNSVQKGWIPSDAHMCASIKINIILNQHKKAYLLHQTKLHKQRTEQEYDVHSKAPNCACLVCRKTKAAWMIGVGVQPLFQKFRSIWHLFDIKSTQFTSIILHQF